MRQKFPIFMMGLLISLVGFVSSTGNQSVSASLLGELDSDTTLCANIGSGYERPTSYPDGWPMVPDWNIGSGQTTRPFEGGATNWNCRTDTGLHTSGNYCVTVGSGTSCTGYRWAYTVPVGTPIQIGKSDIENNTNGAGFARSLTKIEWDMNGDGAFEIARNGPWLTAYGEMGQCSGQGCLSSRTTRSQYFEETFTPTTIGTTTVTLRATYSDNSTNVSSAVFTAEADSVTAVINRIDTPTGIPNDGAPVLTGSRQRLSAARSTASSGSIAKYEWDLDGDGLYEVDSGTTNTYDTAFFTAGNSTVGVRVTSRGGSSSTATMTIEVRQAPPTGEPGLSIENGTSFVNSRNVSLNLVWPEYATEARISNDGGFAATKTKTIPLASTVNWILDDTVKGVYTKVVYVRFSGTGVDTTKTYSDDIILDTNAPTLESSTAKTSSTAIVVSLKATDDITGVDEAQISSGTTTITENYSSKISISPTDLGLSISATGLKKSAASSLRIRVSDVAGNWTAWQSVALTGVSTLVSAAPTVSTKKTTTAKSLAVYAKLKVLPTSRVSLRVLSVSANYCNAVGTTLRGKKPGLCKVSVTVTPKKGRATSRTVTIKVLR